MRIPNQTIKGRNFIKYVLVLSFNIDNVMATSDNPNKFDEFMQKYPGEFKVYKEIWFRPAASDLNDSLISFKERKKIR